MAKFVVGTPVVTNTPLVEVTADPAQLLSPGRHHFQLIVTDDSGNVSAADEANIIVADQDKPTAVLTAPSVVASGRSFNLDGSRSFDTGGGKVVKWEWAYLGKA